MLRRSLLQAVKNREVSNRLVHWHMVTTTSQRVTEKINRIVGETLGEPNIWEGSGRNAVQSRFKKESGNCKKPRIHLFRPHRFGHVFDRSNFQIALQSLELSNEILSAVVLPTLKLYLVRSSATPWLIVSATSSFPEYDFSDITSCCHVPQVAMPLSPLSTTTPPFQSLSTLFLRSYVCHILGVNGLVNARFLRYDMSGQKEDSDKCSLGARDATRDMEEIVLLCHELLGSVISTIFPVETFSTLFVLICSELFRGRNFQLVDEVVACLRDAAKENHDEARTHFEKVIDANRPEENPDSDPVQAWIGVIGLATSRVPYFDNPEHLRGDIISLSFHAPLYLPEHSRPAAFEGPFDFNAVRETDPKTAIEQKILDLKDLLSKTSLRTPRHSECLDRLAMWYKVKFTLTNDITDLEESIMYHRLLLDVPDFNVSRLDYLN
ncbi:hypothetical protein EDB84DRAFT_1672896 [Lactarius hengduanensis]|nr:hypothetical protein EDB84DRAFT_1672896 [Lactarius hengduanensis]